MDDKTFGTLALDLLKAANIPGAMLDQALAFRARAQAMIDGADAKPQPPVAQK